MDDDLFDKDKALDFIIYDESEKKETNPKNNAGCLGSIVLFLIFAILLSFKSINS